MKLYLQLRLSLVCVCDLGDPQSSGFASKGDSFALLLSGQQLQPVTRTDTEGLEPGGEPTEQEKKKKRWNPPNYEGATQSQTGPKSDGRMLMPAFQGPTAEETFEGLARHSFWTELRPGSQ